MREENHMLRATCEAETRIRAFYAAEEEEPRVVWRVLPFLTGRDWAPIRLDWLRQLLAVARAVRTNEARTEFKESR